MDAGRVVEGSLMRRSFGVAVGALALGGSALGTPESLVLILDPTNAESMYVGNYYKQARGVPDANVIYMTPGAVDFAAFAAFNIPALQATIAARGIEAQADYIVIMPGAPFYVDAPGLVNDTCSPVTRFSITGAYTLAYQADQTLAGGVPVLNANRFSSTSYTPARFDAELSYSQGEPSSNTNARQYYIGAMLGYTGTRGNSVDEILAMIDRSVAADFTSPAGTFYYMETNDAARSDPREGAFDAAVAQLANIGEQGVHLTGSVIPTGNHDCLGIMTGHANPDTAGDFTLLSGSFADHLTSWAATFDRAQQVKVSAWITAGASGSWGAVEEPCNYSGKFPHARVHVLYAMGMPLGAAVFRSVSATPYQGLLYGDPMARAFDTPPLASLTGVPVGDASGTLTLMPNVTLQRSGSILVRTELLVDNVRVSTSALNIQHTLDTTTLSDGWHDLRLLAFEVTPAEFAGAYTTELIVNNHGRSATISPSATTGTRTSAITFTLGAAGAGRVVETRLVQNGRVVAAVPGGGGVVSVYGQTLGAGVSRVFAEALFDDGSRVKSAPVEIDVSYSGPAPGAGLPVAFDSHALATAGEATLVMFPHTTDALPEDVALEIVSGPAQATLEGPGGPFRLLTPDAGATGYDEIEYRVSTASGDSNVATMVVVYDAFPSDCPGDLSPPPNGDGLINTNDFFQFLSYYQAMDLRADFAPTGGDGLINTNDFFAFLAAYQAGC